MCRHRDLDYQLERLKQQHGLIDVKPLAEMSNLTNLQTMQNAMANALSKSKNPDVISYRPTDFDSIDQFYNSTFR